MLKNLVLLFSLLWHSPFYGQTFNKSLRDNSSQFIGGVRDLELTTSHLYNQEVESPSINPTGFKLQLRPRGYVYRVNVEHLSPLAKFNPRWQIELAYVTPWMVGNWFRFVFKLKSNIYPNYGGTVDESNHFTSTDRVFDLVPEFDLLISPYFFIAFKDKSLFILSLHYAKSPAPGHWINFEATAELFAGDRINADGSWRAHVWERSALTFEYSYNTGWKWPGVIAVQFYTELGIIFRGGNIGFNKDPNDPTSYIFNNDEFLWMTWDFEVRWRLHPRVGITFPLIETGWGSGKKDYIHTVTKEKFRQVPYSVAIDLNLSITF